MEYTAEDYDILFGVMFDEIAEPIDIEDAVLL
jgi:hypothetical protein